MFLFKREKYHQNQLINTLNMLNIASKTLNTIIKMMMLMIIMIITITVTTTVMLIIVTIIAIFGPKRQLALALYSFYISYDIVVIKAENQCIIG